ncbi:MAG TPA: hypothetical protein VK077_00890 [Virgibacillus sp.]|nr:hypothetical protein [Virgibacillus sp.]
MICQACGQETEKGRFCAQCGAQLTADESAAAAETDPITINGEPVQGVEQTSTSSEEEVLETRAESEASSNNEFIEKTKEIAINFGQLFVNQLKRPMEAKNVNHKHLYSGIISIVIFTIIMSLNTYLGLRDYAYYYGGDAFLDGFLLPFVKLLILFAVVIAIVFAGVKLCNQSHSFTDIVAKYGAYIVPFLSLYVLGFIFSLVDLSSLYILAFSLSLLGSIFVVPAVIVLEQQSKGFDALYIIIGMQLIGMIAFGFLTSSFLEMLFGNILGNIMGIL